MTEAFNIERYHVGGLSKDVWVLIGQHSNVFTKIQIAATCTKLRELYSNRFDLARWGKLGNYIDGPYEAIKCRDYDLTDFFIKKNGNITSKHSTYYGCVYRASFENRRDVVDYCINKINQYNQFIQWDGVIQCAAEGGHRDLVDYFISIGTSNGTITWNWGLAGAAKGGHRDLVDFFISKGANWFEYAHSLAQRYGHKDLAKYIREKQIQEN